MKQQAIVLLLLIANLVVSCATDEAEELGYPPSVFPDRIMMTIPGNPATSRAVTWRTTYGNGNGVAQLVVADADPRHVENSRDLNADSVPWEEGSQVALGHRVVFDGLDPDTCYSYRVGDGEIWSEWFQFETSTDEHREFSFLYFGDLQNDVKSLGSRILRQAYRHTPHAEFMLFAGDLVDRSRDKNWGEFFDAGGWIFGTTPTLASPGNHEYDRSGKGSRTFSRHWRQIFTFPENGPEGLRHRAYFVDYQGARLISLDSYLITADAASREAQTEWLKKVLADNPNNWTILFMHHPVFSCSYGRDNPELRKLLQSILEEFGVDLVLQGHDHTYCRGKTASQEVSEGSIPVYLVSVAGPKMYGLNLEDWKDRVASRTQLYQAVTVGSDKIVVNSYTVLGELYDSFEIVDEDGVKRFVENPEVSEIPTRSEIPESFLERYKSEEIERFRGLYSE